MGEKNKSGYPSAFKRWNTLRSALSKEIRKPGAIKLQPGQYNELAQQIYHSTKDIPISKVIGGLGQRLSTETQPSHPFTDPILFYEIDSEMTSVDLSMPTNVWYDSSVINGSGYYQSDYSYAAVFQKCVNSIDQIWNSRIANYDFSGTPYFYLTQPSWNPVEKRWESVWIITDKSGSALPELNYNPENNELIWDLSGSQEELDQLGKEKTTEEPTPEPKEKPTPTPEPISPEMDKAKAREITSSDLQKRLTYLKAQKKEQESDFKLYKELGDPELLAEAKNSLLQTIKSITAITKELGNV